MEGFGQRLKAQRKALGMKTQDLAVAAGTSPAYIRQLECQWRRPGLGLAVKLANALGTTVEDLLSDTQGQTGAVPSAA